MQIGIIGLMQSGKTTLFKSLSKSSDSSVNISSIKVPDKRVTKLSEIFKPKKTTYAYVEFKDVTIKLDEQGSFSGNTINEIKESDALAIVLRNFKNDTVSHIKGNIDATRDLKEIEDELYLTDLLQIERRLERIKKEGKKGNKEHMLLSRLKEELENGVPIFHLLIKDDEKKIVSGFKFLSEKPFIIVINSDENESILDDTVIKYIEEKRYDHIKIYGKIEEEISQLNPEEQIVFLNDIGLSESVIDRFIKKCYSVLNLISFLTTGEDEVKAWTIKRGSTALEAASKIHTDISRGFIRAEVVPFDTFIKYGSFSKLKEEGLLKLEGKDYIVKDGEIVHFRFNV